MCPYLDSAKYCKLTGVYQEYGSGYHFQTYCLSASNWMNCPNYQTHSK